MHLLERGCWSANEDRGASRAALRRGSAGLGPGTYAKLVPSAAILKIERGEKFCSPNSPNIVPLLKHINAPPSSDVLRQREEPRERSESSSPGSNDGDPFPLWNILHPPTKTNASAANPHLSRSEARLTAPAGSGDLTELPVNALRESNSWVARSSNMGLKCGEGRERLSGGSDGVKADRFWWLALSLDK